MARPPRLPDVTILQLIEEMRAQHAVLTGTRLRDELIRRHGSPCGVSRIYRLLHQVPAPKLAPSPAPPPTTAVDQDRDDMQSQLTAALERAQLAEHREEAHLERWANEIHRLREEAHGFRDASHRLRVLEQDVLDRSRELAAAYLRIAGLEARLR